MALTEKEILHIAKLAAIELKPNEVEKTQHQINDILEYVEKLSAVSTRGVAPTSHVHGVINCFRQDITKESLSPEELKQNAPDFWAGNFRVPRII